MATFSNATGNTAESDCQNCTAGMFNFHFNARRLPDVVNKPLALYIRSSRLDHRLNHAPPLPIATVSNVTGNAAKSDCQNHTAGMLYLGMTQVNWILGFGISSHRRRIKASKLKIIGTVLYVN